MKTNFVLIPQTKCALTNALREYELAHAVWFNTSVFTEEGKAAKEAKDKARARYEAAYKSHNPTHIIL